ncbi:MAG: DUF2254 domain-containing protein [Parachlamydiaceae bacterium]|nr:DUF2254 domain-containing protein [Parachlamydiaceae bacterium]
MIKIKTLWNYLFSTLWFLPTIIVIFSIILAIGLIAIKIDDDGQLLQQFRLFGSGSAEARIMLSTIAGSMMTIIGITFSMTIVALALASNQYTSRILRNFMGDRLTQTVIGVFVGIFSYCLVVLCTIRSPEEGVFVPSLAVFFAFLLALVGVGILVFFIHHIASSMQASIILKSVADETFKAIDRIYPEKMRSNLIEKHTNLPNNETFDDFNWRVLFAEENGYIQSINLSRLKRLAKNKDLIIRMEHKIGEFVIKNAPLAYIASGIMCDQETIESIHFSFYFSPFRSIDEDVAFGIRQLVDIALKALSPGINDTTTAVMCLNYLTAILVQVVARKFTSSHHYEEEKLLIITNERNFKSFLDESFNEIRDNAKENITIILKLLESIQLIARQTTSEDILQNLKKQSSWTEEMVRDNIKSSHNRETIKKRLLHTNSILEDQLALYRRAF